MHPRANVSADHFVVPFLLSVDTPPSIPALT